MSKLEKGLRTKKREAILRYKGLRFLVPNECYWPYYGVCFIGEYDRLLDGISKDDVVLDAGANIGIFSLLAAQKSAKVISVEPDHTNYNYLLHNIKLNKANNITPVKVALLNYEGNSYISGKGLLVVLSQRGLQVKVKPIDGLLEELSINNVNLVKMNIEGSESKALKGTYLANVRALIIEVHGKRNYDVCLGVLRSNGFVIEEWRFPSSIVFRRIFKDFLDFLDAELKTKFMASKIALKYALKMEPYPMPVAKLALRIIAERSHSPRANTQSKGSPPQRHCL